MTHYSEAFVSEHIEDFRQRFYALQEDTRFQNAITISTNDVRNVDTRFDLIKQAHADLPSDLETT